MLGKDGQAVLVMYGGSPYCIYLSKLEKMKDYREEKTSRKAKRDSHDVNSSKNLNKQKNNVAS